MIIHVHKKTKTHSHRQDKEKTDIFQIDLKANIRVSLATKGYLVHPIIHLILIFNQGKEINPIQVIPLYNLSTIPVAVLLQPIRQQATPYSTVLFYVLHIQQNKTPMEELEIFSLVAFSLPRILVVTSTAVSVLWGIDPEKTSH